MSRQATRGSCKGSMWLDAAATTAAGKAKKDVLRLLHGCPANKAMPPSPAGRRGSASIVLACVTLGMLCSLLQLPVAALQLPGSTPNATHPQEIHNDSTTHTQQVFLGRVPPRPPRAGPPSWRVSAARKLRQDQSEGTRTTEAGTAAAAADALPPPHLQEGPPHTRGRIPRSLSAVESIELHGPLLPDRRTLFVEVVVIADNSFCTHYRTHEAAVKRVAQLLGIANKVLAGVGVMLVPADVQFWERGDKFTVDSKMKTNVASLQKHRLSLLQQGRSVNNDHTVLLTRTHMGRRAPYGGPRRGMCRQKESVSVVQDEGEAPSLAGVALAHQVGLSLGMDDDAEDADHACHCHADTCVMSRHFRNASTPKLEWSSCSRDSLNSMMDTLALDCLRNVPMTRSPSARCGDGVVDAGEQCDCGPAEFCDNPCCNTSTCMLAASASCASGSCCDTLTCKPKPPGTVCRAALGECDVPEFCSGHSEYCPVDVTRAHGVPCHGGQGHCYNGECGSHEGRCTTLWGASAAAASPECYSKLNVQGNRAGNCGLEFGRYSRCQPEESLCGTLHCLAPAPPVLRLPDHRNESRPAGSHECHFISGSEYYPAHHWLVPGGASCGPGKMCVDQRCQEIPGPVGDCRGGCSGHGVCNTRGNCHCDAGYSPPDCSVAGLGGSVDSNVMAGPADSRALITSLWVLLVLLLSMLAVTCCSWGFFKGWYKRKGREHTSRVLPCCVTCLDAYCCPVMTKAARWMLTVRSSTDKKQSNINGEAEEGLNEHMLCKVDIDVQSTAQTNSWGVANEKLVTEVVTITPKNSPDLHRKVMVVSDPANPHRKSHNNGQRPKYLQSISMDSGCISGTDEEDSSNRSSLHLSMSSLISTFRKIGSKSERATSAEKEINPSRNFSSQKSVPLRRLVTDRLARQGTPPPEKVRPAYCRSFSTDTDYTGNVRAGRAPPPLPSSSLKPTKSEDNLSKSTDMPNRVRDDSTTNGRRMPLRPPKNKPVPSPPKAPSSRHNSPSPPQTTGHRNHGGKLQGKSSPPRGAPRPSPPAKTWSEPQKSSPETEASRKNNKVMAMARKFDGT